MTADTLFLVRSVVHIPLTNSPPSVSRSALLQRVAHVWGLVAPYFFRIKTMDTTITRTHVLETDRMDREYALGHAEVRSILRAID